ncbi:biotin transporter BioY [candidate division KSB1 bacterium]|nr:biotin transporter BioY [candidate division KSB1 bacterium]
MNDFKRTRLLILCAIFASLTMLGGLLKIHLFLVPFTLQTFFVLLSGIVLGPYWGFVSQLIYLLIGLIGFPVFANGGGIMYIFQPTFGYLLGFPVATFVVGFLLFRMNITDNMRCWIQLFLYNFAGVLNISISGVIFLYFNLKFITKQPLPFYQIFWSGLLIFLPVDIVKVFLLSLLAHRILKYKFF